LRLNGFQQIAFHANAAKPHLSRRCLCIGYFDEACNKSVTPSRQATQKQNTRALIDDHTGLPLPVALPDPPTTIPMDR
jgi:hypothetical protein